MFYYISWEDLMVLFISSTVEGYNAYAYALWAVIILCGRSHCKHFIQLS